nr:SOS response-associated peptidase [Paracoccaceae bacterium]
PEAAPRRNVSPGEEIIVFNAERQLVPMRLGLIPVGRVNARGRPVMETIINARSETVFDKSAFEGVKRAVVPADGWYEWTGKARRKQAWRIGPKDGSLLFFAAITDVWSAPGGLKVPQVATVTCEPSADVRDIHHRMGVLLKEGDISVWLGPDEAAARSLMVPFPDGLLTVEAADDVDWDAP